MKRTLAIFSVVIMMLFIMCGSNSWAARGRYGNFVHKGNSGHNVMGYNAKGNGSDNDSGAFTTAIAAAAGNRIIIPEGTYKLSTNVTIPSGVSVELDGLLSIDNGVTFTLSQGSSLIAGPRQIFSGAGSVVFGKGTCEYVLTEWWGAIGNNSTDCTAAFDSAMTAAANVGVVKISTGTYIISSPLRNWPTGSPAAQQSGIIIQGNGTFTELRYTGTTGYCLEVTPANDLDAVHPIGNTIQDLHMSAPNIADPDDGGCILFAASYNQANRITIDDADNATGIHCRSRDVDQSEASMTNDTNRDFTTTGAGVTEKYAIKFTTQSRAQHIYSVTARLAITGAPAGTIHAEIWTDSSGPNAQTGVDSNTVTLTGVSSAADGEDVTFTWEEKSKLTCSASTNYWLVLSTEGYTYADGVTEVRLRVDAGDGGANEFATFTWGGAWATSNDGANHAVKVRFGQCIQARLDQCGFYGATRVGRALWLSKDAICNVTNSFFGAKEGVKADQGILHANGLYLYCTDAPLRMYSSWTFFESGWIEATGGTPCFFSGSRRTHILSNSWIGYAPMTWESGTEFRQVNCSKDVFHTSTNAEARPDIFLWQVFAAVGDIWDGAGYSIAADADSQNGYAVQLDARYDVARVHLKPGDEYYANLPRGTYKITMLIKDSNQVANDVDVYIDKHTGIVWTTKQNVTQFTATADYRPYTFFMIVEASEVGNIGYGRRFRISKATASTNTISIGHVIMEYMGLDTPGAGDLSVYNPIASDADSARQSSLYFFGRKSTDEVEPLAQIEASHKGTGGDHQGQLEIKINDGNDPLSGLTTEVTIDEDRVTLAGDLTVSGDDIKMATNTDTYIFVADGTEYSPVAMSGDATITNTGVISIEAGAIDYENTVEGINWTSRTSAAENAWSSVAYGDGLFVAVAFSGTGNRVMTSPDGVNWTSRTSAADNDWMSVTYGNGLFVAIAETGTGNRVMTSPDGITWTIRTSAANNEWHGIAYGNGIFTAVAVSGTGNRVMTSPDGVNWTIRTSAADNNWYSVTYGNGLFVATAYSGTGNRVMTSPDGVTWTIRTSAADNPWGSVTYGNGLFVAISALGTGNRVMTSPDGVTWTIRTSAANNGWLGVTYGDGLFVAVAYSGSGNRVMTSPDGLTWTTRTSAANNEWEDITYGNGIFVAVASFGNSNRVMTSGAQDSNVIQKKNIYHGDTVIHGGLVSNTYNFAADGEASDAYVVTLTPAPTAYATGMMIIFTANTANTGACTVNVNGLGATALKMLHDQEPADNYIEADSVVVAVYDSTNFQLISPDANP